MNSLGSPFVALEPSFTLELNDCCGSGFHSPLLGLLGQVPITAFPLHSCWLETHQKHSHRKVKVSTFRVWLTGQNLLPARRQREQGVSGCVPIETCGHNIVRPKTEHWEALKGDSRQWWVQSLQAEDPPGGRGIRDERARYFKHTNTEAKKKQKGKNEGMEEYQLLPQTCMCHKRMTQNTDGGVFFGWKQGEQRGMEEEEDCTRTDHEESTGFYQCYNKTLHFVGQQKQLILKLTEASTWGLVPRQEASQGEQCWVTYPPFKATYSHMFSRLEDACEPCSVLGFRVYNSKDIPISK